MIPREAKLVEKKKNENQENYLHEIALLCELNDVDIVSVVVAAPWNNKK